MLHICTLNWNGKNKIDKLLPSIVNATNGVDYFWHMRDHGSKDLTDEDIELWESQANLKVYKIGHNRNTFSEGMNWLFDQTQPKDDDYILFLNNDVEFGDTESIKSMIKILDKDPNVGIVGARLLYKGTNKLQHGGVIFGQRYNFMPYHFKHKEECLESDAQNKEFQAVTGAALMIRASSFIKVNKFTLDLKWAFDDIDLCLKVGKNLGQKVVYCGSTVIYHEESASLKKNPVDKLFLNGSIKYFRNTWTGRYDADHEKYLRDPNYNVYKR